MNVSDLPRHGRPREKLFEKGPEALSDSELLAILLRSGFQGTNAIELAAKILRHYRLNQLFTQSLSKLQAIKGVGLAKATTIRAVAAIISRVQASDSCVSISKPPEVFSLVQHLLTKKQEHLVALYLNGRNQLIAQETITIGTLNASLIHARELFAPAISHRAAGMIIVHNHPSGELQPSDEDLVTTDRLVEAGHLLDIPILDHLIVSTQGYFSFKHHQLL